MLVHDAARALAPASLFEAVIAQVGAGSPAVVPGLPVSDTIKVVDAAGRVDLDTLARARCAPSRHRRGSGARSSSAPTPAAPAPPTTPPWSS